VPFFSVAGAEFVESLVGVGAARVRDLFARCAPPRPRSCSSTRSTPPAASAGPATRPAAPTSASRPSTSCSSRSTGSTSPAASSSWARRTVPTSSTRRCCVPGRFDRHVTIDQPDANGRAHPRAAREAASRWRRRRPRASRPPHPGVHRRGPRQRRERGRAARHPGGTRAGRHGRPRPRRCSGSCPARSAAAVCSPRRSGAASPPTRPATPSWPRDRPRRGRAAHLGRRARPRAGQRPARQRPRRGAVHPLQLEDQLATALSGRAAEELLFGEPSTGSDADLERATDLARDLVARHGMSERLGRVRLMAAESDLFLGGGRGARPALRADPPGARRRGAPPRRRGVRQATEVLAEHRGLLDHLVERLLAARPSRGPSSSSPTSAAS
jgi:cell division protease FtsH